MAAELTPANAAALNEEFAQMSVRERLEWVFQQDPAATMFTSSFGIKSTGFICLVQSEAQSENYQPVWATIDTGFLFKETHTHRAAANKLYHMHVNILKPPVALYGANLVKHRGKLWETNRAEYLRLVKEQPLREFIAKSNKTIWVSGLRRSSAHTRQAVKFVDWDGKWGVFRINPIADWDNRRLGVFMKHHGCAYHALFGTYESVGDTHSTFVDEAGKTQRNGGNFRECGLHTGIAPDAARKPSPPAAAPQAVAAGARERSDTNSN